MAVLLLSPPYSEAVKFGAARHEMRFFGEAAFAPPIVPQSPSTWGRIFPKYFFPVSTARLPRPNEKAEPGPTRQAQHTMKRHLLL